jgi:hypothetical protein
LGVRNWELGIRGWGLNENFKNLKYYEKQIEKCDNDGGDGTGIIQGL